MFFHLICHMTNLTKDLLKFSGLPQKLNPEIRMHLFTLQVREWVNKLNINIIKFRHFWFKRKLSETDRYRQTNRWIEDRHLSDPIMIPLEPFEVPNSKNSNNYCLYGHSFYHDKFLIPNDCISISQIKIKSILKSNTSHSRK